VRDHECDTGNGHGGNGAPDARQPPPQVGAHGAASDQHDATEGAVAGQRGNGESDNQGEGGQQRGE